MATAKSFAQHFVECESCEQNPAQFLCKTCPGHLCETCKTEHETRKITKNHEVIHLHKNMEGTLGLLLCEKHRLNKVEWYCNPCKEPVCTKCHIESHNGHKMEELAATYKQIIGKLKEEKGKIENLLLPKYEELLTEEKIKKSEMSKRSNEVRKQIEDHTKSIMDQVTRMKENALQNLKEQEKKAIGSMEETESEIETKIEILKKINEDISRNLCTSPGIMFFKNTDSELLNDMQDFPSTVNYKLDNFHPGDLFITERQFGKCPQFIISKKTNLRPGIFLREEKNVEEALLLEIERLELSLRTEKRPLVSYVIEQQIASKKSLLWNLRKS